MSFLRGRFLPVADDHLASLNKMTMLIGDAAQSLSGVFGEASIERDRHVLRIADARRDCNQIARDISRSLGHTFITAIDREDIHALASALDVLMRGMDGLVQWAEIYEIREHNADVRRFADLVQQMAAELKILVPFINHPDDIRKRLIEIRRVDREGKEIYRKAVGELFRSGSDLQDLIARKDLYENLRAALSQCQSVGTLVELITIKNA